MSINTAKVVKIIDQKTARILIITTKRHDVTGKVQRINSEILANIQSDEIPVVGDIVEIVPCKKASKNKAFAILRIQKNTV